MCFVLLLIAFDREVFKQNGGWKYEGFKRENGGCENEGKTKKVLQRAIGMELCKKLWLQS